MGCQKVFGEGFRRIFLCENFPGNVFSRFLVLEPHFEFEPAWGLGLTGWGLGAVAWGLGLREVGRGSGLGWAGLGWVGWLGLGLGLAGLARGAGAGAGWVGKGGLGLGLAGLARRGWGWGWGWLG